MPIYKQTTEITNIDDLLSSVERDIEEVYFGDKQVFTVWAEYEGTLPATINANGDNLRQYQIYGNTGGVGDKTINYFDYTQLVDGYTYNSNGQMILNPDESNRWKFAAIPFIQVTPGATYLRTWNLTSIGDYNTIYCYDSEKNYIVKIFGPGVPFTVPNNCNFITYVEDISSKDRKKYMLTEGSTAPASFVPFGYKVDISTSDGTSMTTTPIYIGNDPLEKVGNYSDYVDYELQKVVRAIKKYVLTGNENWEEITGAFASRTYFRWVFETLNYCVRHVCTCSHFTQTNITTATTTVGFNVFDSTSVNGEVLAIRPSGVQSTTLEDFKAWLAEQYAAGTPVTVWCALTVAEEADPPVALPALPTVDGATIVDYAGQSVAPEKAILKYRKKNF